MVLFSVNFKIFIRIINIITINNVIISPIKFIFVTNGYNTGKTLIFTGIINYYVKKLKALYLRILNLKPVYKPVLYVILAGLILFIYIKIVNIFLSIV